MEAEFKSMMRSLQLMLIGMAFVVVFVVLFMRFLMRTVLSFAPLVKEHLPVPFNILVMDLPHLTWPAIALPAIPDLGGYPGAFVFGMGLGAIIVGLQELRKLEREKAEL